MKILDVIIKGYTSLGTMTWSAVRRLCHHFLPAAISHLETHPLTTHYRHILRRPQTYSAISACRKRRCSSLTKDMGDEHGEQSGSVDTAVNVHDSSSILHTHELTGDTEGGVEFEDTAVWNADIQPFIDTRKVGRTFDDQNEIYMLKPDSPPDAKILKVAVIGQPNCGKSTLINSLMGWRVCSVSSKVHTTRKNTMAVYTEGDTQIVFVDTPGNLRPGTRKKLDLERSMELDPVRSFASADLVVAMVNVYWNINRHTIDPQLLQLLYMYRHIPAVLVINKIDLLKKKSEILDTVRMLTDAVIRGKSLDQYKKKKTLTKKEKLFANADKEMGLEVEEVEEEQEDALIPPELTEPVDEAVMKGELDWDTYFNMVRKADKVVRNRRGWPLFEKVFSVSALRQDGILDLKDFLMSKTYPGPWPYHSSLVTDQPPDEVVILSVRQALLDSLMNEVPYELGLDLIMMEADPEGDLLNIVVNITCFSERQLTIFLGRDGTGIRKVSGIAKQAIRDTFRCEVRLKLVANLKKGKRKVTNL